MLYINGMMAALTGFGLIVFLISSIREREWRAVCLASVFMIANFILWFVFIFWKDVLWIKSLNDGVIFLFVLFVFVSLLKWMPRSELRQTASIEQYDERDYMFSRNNLKNHPELAARYYAKFPEKAETDEKIHNKLEIGSPGQLYYEDYYAPVFDAAFVYLSSTRGAAVAAPRNEKKTVDKEKIKQVLRQIGYYYGAVDVGFSPLKSYHIYSHAGRRAETWGQEIKLEHQTAIVIVVAMDVHMIKKAPALPAILESSRQYVEAAKIANIIAEYVRGFGYQARAHTDGNYQVLCVPLAVDSRCRSIRFP